MIDRRKTKDVLWIAFQYAKQDRISFINAYGVDSKDPAVKEAKADIKAFERLQLRIFGTTKTELQSKLDEMIPVPIDEFMKSIKELK